MKNGTPTFDEYYFGCPPVSSSTENLTDFEFILKKSTGLSERHPDRDTFEEYFDEKCDLSVNFLNLKKTSVLVSPFVPTTITMYYLSFSFPPHLIYYLDTGHPQGDLGIG